MLIRENPWIPALAGAAAVAAAAFGVLTVRERDRRLLKQDKRAMGAVGRQLGKHERIAAALHPVGKWYAYVPAAAVAAGMVYARGGGPTPDRAAGAAAVLLAATAGAVVNPVFDKVLPQPPPPPGRQADRQPSFPSGHAFGLGAVALTAAHVLHREEILGPAAAVPLAVLPPLVGGIAKVVEKKHWPSEVVGGFLVAVVISSLSNLVYEVVRGGRPD